MTLQHIYDPNMCGYNFTGPDLAAIRAKLALAEAGVRDCHGVFFGDSTLGGYNGTAYFYDTNLPRSFARQLNAMLGIPWQQGIQYAVGDKTRTADNWALTGSFGTGQTLGTTSNLLFGNGVGTAIRTPPTGETGKSVDIYYSDEGSNAVAWKIATVAQTALVTGATNTIRKTTVGSLSLGPQSIEVDLVAGKNAIIVATRVYDPTVKALHIHNLSLGGSRANGGTADLNWSSTASVFGSPYGLGWIMPNLLTAAGITPDFLVVSLGGNDLANAETTATTLAGIATIQGYYPGVPLILIHAHKINTVTDLAQNQLGAGFYQSADALGAAMFNWDDYVGGLAAATANGLIGADSVHPLQAAQKMLGKQLANLIAA